MKEGFCPERREVFDLYSGAIKTQACLKLIGMGGGMCTRQNATGSDCPFFNGDMRDVPPALVVPQQQFVRELPNSKELREY